MKLEELENTERKHQLLLAAAKTPMHVCGKSTLSIVEPGGHYFYVCDPESGEVERRKVPTWLDPDAHLGAVDA